MVRKITPGSAPRKFPIASYNAFADAANYTEELKRRTANVSTDSNALTVLAYNNTGADLEVGHAAKIDEPRLKADETDTNPARRMPVVELTTPSWNAPVVIAVEPIKDEKFGRVQVVGPAWCRVTGEGNTINFSTAVSTLGFESGDPVLWTSTDNFPDERWGLVWINHGAGSGSTDTCCGQTTPDGEDSLTFLDTGEDLPYENTLTRATTGDDYESDTFTVAGNVGGVAKSGTYKWVGDTDGADLGSSLYAFTVELTNTAGDADFYCTYQSVNPWVSGARMPFYLLNDRELGDITTFPSSFCGGEYP